MKVSAQYRVISTAKSSGIIVSRGSKSTVNVGQFAAIDMPYEDVSALIGWLCCGKSGTTAQRPTNASMNETYIDTTLSKVVFSDGFGKWHDPFTGALV